MFRTVMSLLSVGSYRKSEASPQPSSAISSLLIGEYADDGPDEPDRPPTPRSRRANAAREGNADAAYSFGTSLSAMPKASATPLP